MSGIVDRFAPLLRRAVFDAIRAMAWADGRLEREEILAVSAAAKTLKLPARSAKPHAHGAHSKKLLALPPHVEKAIQATLMFVLKWALAAGLYTLSSISGSDPVNVATPGFVIEVLFIAVGLLCAQTLSSAIAGVMKQMIAIKIAVPMVVVPLLVVGVGAFNVQTSVQARPVVEAPKPAAPAPVESV